MCNCCGCKCNCSRCYNGSPYKDPPPPKFYVGQVVRTTFVKNKVYRHGHPIETDHCGVVEKVIPIKDLLNHKAYPGEHWAYYVRMCPFDKGGGVEEDGTRHSAECSFEAVQHCCCCCHHSCCHATNWGRK